MPVAALAQFDPSRFFQAVASSPQAVQRLDTKVSAISASSDLTGRLSVVTAEGDKITLSADLEARYQGASYRGHAESHGTAVDVSAKSTVFSLKQQYGVLVEGDLNEQELQDLEKLFQNVSSIFRKFFSGQDEAALAKTATLADQFGQASSLSSLDLNVEVERSVTALAAQVASRVTGPSVDSTNTPGGAPGAAVAIPQSSTGTMAPTPPSTAASGADSPEGTHLSAPAEGAQKSASLGQQILDALEESRVESQKVKMHLPDFFKKLREDLRNELRGERADQQHPATDVPRQTDEVRPSANSSVLLAYRSVRQTSAVISIRT